MISATIFAILCCSIFFSNAYFMHPRHFLATKSLKMSADITSTSGHVKNSKEKGPPIVVVQEMAMVGFISQQSDTAEETIFRNVFDRKMAKTLRCVTDSEKFARRRLINPKTVYSGLVDNMKFVEASVTDLEAIERAVAGADGIMIFNISMNALPEYASMIQRLGVKRAILAVDVSGHEADNQITDSYVSSLFRAEEASPIYTVIKYGEYEAAEESKRPFRIVLGTSPVPTNGKFPLAAGDLHRVLTECVDLPKAYNRVFGIGRGNSLDNEILVWMKAQGINVSDRIGVLLSDFQEVSEQRLKSMNEEYKENKAKGILPSAAPKKSIYDDESILSG